MYCELKQTEPLLTSSTKLEMSYTLSWITSHVSLIMLCTLISSNVKYFKALSTVSQWSLFVLLPLDFKLASSTILARYKKNKTKSRLGVG